MLTLVIARLLETRHRDSTRVRDCISLFTTCEAARSAFTPEIQKDLKTLMRISPLRRLVFTSSGYQVGHFQRMKELFDRSDVVLRMARELALDDALHCAGDHCAHARNVVARRHCRRADAPVVHTLRDDSAQTRLVEHAAHAPITVVLAHQRSSVRRGSTTHFLCRYKIHDRTLERTHRIDVSNFGFMALRVSFDGAHTVAFDRELNLFACNWDDSRPGCDKSTTFKKIDRVLAEAAVGWLPGRPSLWRFEEIKAYVIRTGLYAEYRVVSLCLVAHKYGYKGPPGGLVAHPPATSDQLWTWSGWDCAKGYDVPCALWVTHLCQGIIVVC